MAAGAAGEGVVSIASERKAMRELLPGYALVTPKEVAAFLRVGEDVARGMIDDGTIPSVAVGKRRHVDPMDLVAHVLAGREGLTVTEWWEAHGPVAGERIRRYLAAVRTSGLQDPELRTKIA